MSEEESYVIGYKKPPKGSQFKPGQSGNPKGKPRKFPTTQPDLSEKITRPPKIRQPFSSKEVDELAGLIENVKSKSLSEQKIVLQQLCAKAINGDTASSRLLAKSIQQHLKAEPKEPDKQKSMTDVLKALENTTDRALLVEQWRNLYGNEPYKFISRKLLIMGIAYRLQEQAFGGLKPATRRYLAKVAADSIAGRKIPLPTPALKTGTMLLREWHGVTYEVRILEKGVQFNGKTYRSLTAVAQLITGVHWSGPRFFGLKKAR